MRREPGRVRTKLARVLLDQLGLIVDPYEMWVQEGGYRHRYWDLARWGAYDVVWTPEKQKEYGGFVHRFNIAAWDTMTCCVRHGVGLVSDPKSERSLIELCSMR